ncbi:efflux RND transporter periplasmic adaptor subunit [uncultured Desulfosarcina sp.]|uniref:efflux RND transporter periplasmic adaptor subunit n=1 Tax=uncultured Desulfosarcina sp. TaxID=218289 RepID=UPI0029C95A00|nr:efflux RND transporter periplasmic adaptor subunit [uncultured Desulfosarcina sp.]
MIHGMVSNRSRIVGPRPIIWAAALLLLLVACKNEKATPAAASRPPTVTAMEIVTRDVPVAFEYIAQTQSSHLVNIQARVSGFLDQRRYTEGELVKEGQVLFQMDAKPFQVQLAQAQAALAKQNAALETSRQNLARTKPLVRQNALSKKDLDDATGQFQSAAAGVDQANAQVEAAKLDLSYTTIASPVTGISGSALQTDGTYISPQNSLLTTVAVLDPIWVNFNISENEMQRYRNQIAQGLLKSPEDKNYRVEIVLVDGSVFPHAGRMTFADPSYDTQTGTFRVRASVPNPDGILRPNQYVRARLTGAVRPQAILVPQRAVQQGSKGHFVWVVGADSKVTQRPVTVGSWLGDDWFIFEGLNGGERVAIDGTLMLQPGMTVSVAEAAPETQGKTAGQ